MQVVRAGQVLAEHPMPPGTELVVGRSEGCGVTIPDSSVSRMHLRFVSEGAGIYVEDLGSANGSFLDGERLHSRVLLAGGQQVRAAQKALSAPVLLRIVAPDAVAAGATVAASPGEIAAPPPIGHPPTGHEAPPHRPRPPEPPTRPSSPPRAVATPLESPARRQGSRRTLVILALVGVAVFGALAVAAGVAWVMLKPSADATLAAVPTPRPAPSARPVPAAPPPQALVPDTAVTPVTVALPAGIESIPPAGADVTPALASAPTDTATATATASPSPAPVAASPTKLTGKWALRLDNLFYPDEEYIVELRVELQQRGRALSGKGQVVMEGQAMTFGVPATSVTGSVRGKDPLEVRLEVQCGRPVGVLQLQGTVAGDAMAGTFRSSLLKGEGGWQAVRTP